MQLLNYYLKKYSMAMVKINLFVLKMKCTKKGGGRVVVCNTSYYFSTKHVIYKCINCYRCVFFVQYSSEMSWPLFFSITRPNY